ncbi:MAG: bifunctional glycosyltransferase/class I SAM-dependent methyltransferase [Elusimicrobiota bacterium]|jgi:dolichol-phosphate mannosyltransferase
MKLLVGIPAFNVAPHIEDVLRRIDRNAVSEILVVDDGSTDATPAVLKTIPGLTVIRHPSNQGYGATQKTLLRYFQEHYQDAGNDVLVFLHGDGEMKPEEIPDLLEPLRNDPSLDICFGSRPLRARQESRDDSTHRPQWKRWMDAGITSFLNQLLGLRFSTYFGGFRAIRLSAAQKLCVDHLDNRHFFDQQLIVQTGKLGFRIQEVPISNVETGGLSNYSKLKVGLALLRMAFWPATFWKTTRQRSSCMVCGSDAWRLWISPNTAPARITNIHSDEFGLALSLFRCAACGFIRVDPREMPGDIEAGYETFSDPVYLSEKDSRVQAFQPIVEQLARESPPPAKLLEIGSGAGFFLKAAHDRGYRAVGIEPSRERCRYAVEQLGLDVRQGTYDRAAVPESGFDIVVMADVFEHVLDPDQLMRYISGKLRPGGYLLMIDPDVDSWMARGLKQRWWGINKVHFHYIGRRTIQSLLGRYGLQTLRIQTFPHVFTLVHWSRFLRNYQKWMADAFDRLIKALHLGHHRIRLNAFDFITILARKSE